MTVISGDDLPREWTQQAVFEHVSRHLFRQGRKAAANGDCLYRGPDGTCCAVGCLIPDEVYSESMEGRCIHALIHQDARDSLAYLEPFSQLLESLQSVHDSSSAWESSRNMRAELRHVGEGCGLKVGFLRRLRFAWDGKGA
jgi:hypothetical protein